ncbi:MULTISPECIES: hypothetical protein [unclassified Niallia]|uniref:hypothetical protein n=2 Tax=Niallia TaxID=2837506 RepID=UPI0030FBA886
MGTLLIMLLFAVGAYVFMKIMLKEPIIPGRGKKATPIKLNKKNNENGKNNPLQAEEDPKIFEELFSDVKDISNHLIHYTDYSFSIIAEVDPVNYFLKSQFEQEAIDVTFESWTATLNYPVSVYLQNRFVDVSEPIEAMNKVMEESKDLNEAALSFGKAMIADIVEWQKSAPRFETKIYMIFTHKINVNSISADSEEELEEKIVDKAFAELMRRVNSARNQLRKADIHVSLLPTEGIYELLYYTFNRRKAVKNRFKDLVNQEKDALYVTADQTDSHIDLVKETIQEYEDNENERERAREKEAS